MSEKRDLLAVLIDADNVPSKFAEAILEEVTRSGEPGLRRVYGDFTSPHLKEWAKKIPDLGLVAHQETANSKNKNANDIGLVIDAMDILHSGRFDGFVLVSSDSDFTALANRLREHGKTVIGIGEKKTLPALINACNRFIFLENLEKIENANGRDKAADAFRYFKEAMDKIDTSDEWYHLGGVGSVILARHPEFDPRSYGHAKLSNLAAAIGKLEFRRQNGHPMVRLKD